MNQRFHGFPLVLALLSSAAAVDYEKASVISMRALPCPGSTSAGLMQLGAEISLEADCTEYVLATSRVLYRVRPRDSRLLLPVGETVLIKLTDRELRVRMAGNEKEARFLVTEMTLVQEERGSQRPPRADAVPENRQAEPSARRTCLSRDGEAVPCRRE